jgi:hypothetical protein
MHLVAHVRVLLTFADASLARTADYRQEDGARRVFARKAGFAHAGAIVDNNSSHRTIIVRHAFAQSID